MKSHVEALEVVQGAYVELTKYTAKTRSYAGMLDGLKTSYRRALIQTEKYKSFTKSASLVGETMKIHVHGDASVYGVLVNMACKYGKFPLYNSKGNFGGLSFGPSASRYTEAYLNDISRKIFLDLSEYADMSEGEVMNEEISYLPSLLPYCFLAGSSGMTVGLPTPCIPALSPIELIDYYISKIKKESTTYPHFNEGKCVAITPKCEIDNILKTGRGSVRYRPIINKESYNTLVVNEGTPGADISKSIEKLKRYIDDELVSFTNETSQEGYRYVFSINNLNKLSLKELHNILTRALSSTVSYRIIVENEGLVYQSSLDYISDKQLEYLYKCVLRKFNDLYSKSLLKSKVYEAIKSLKESDYISKLGSYSKEDLISIIVNLGYDKDTAMGVLSKPISYLTKDHNSEYIEILNNINIYKSYIDNPDEYIISKYEELRSMILSTMNKYCTRTLSEEEVVSLSPKRVDLVENKLIFTKEGSILLSDNNSILLVTDSCKFCRYNLPMTEDSEYSLGTNDNYIIASNDAGKYFVVIYKDRWNNIDISVNISSTISVGTGLYIRLRGESSYYPIKCFTTDNNLITISGNNHSFDINLDYFLTNNRRRYPQYLTSKDLGDSISYCNTVIDK